MRKLSAPGWNGWGVDPTELARPERRRPRACRPDRCRGCTLKWAFGFPGATALYGQAVIDGRLYVTSNAGLRLLARCRDRMRPLVVPIAGGRAQRVHGRPPVADGRIAWRVFFGDIHGMAYALDASTGEVIWKIADRPASARPHHRHAGAPRRPLSTCRSHRSKSLNRAGRLRLLHIPRVSSRRSTRRPASRSGRPTPFRRAEGRRQELARQGHARRRPAPAIWVTPILDLKRRALYFGTGNAFSGTPQTANAIMAVSMDTGKVLWSMQALPLDVWHNGCPQTIPGRAAGGRAAEAPARRRGRCRRRRRPRGRAGGARRHSVSAGELSDSARPRLGLLRSSSLATTADGRDIIIAPQKQGLVWALNPDTGAVLWKQDVAREIAGGRGETLFGGAVDQSRRRTSASSAARIWRSISRPARKCGTRPSCVRPDARTSAASSAPSR